MTIEVGQLEADYASSGITAERVASLLSGLADKRPGHGALPIQDASMAVYVNSSDPIGAISRHLELRDKSVLTVAGCGDLPLLFISKACASICIADVSPFALFLTELKVRAVEQLLRADYFRLFMLPELNDNDFSGPFFEGSLYRSLRASLSLPARTYFDMLHEPRYHFLATVNAQDVDNTKFVRHRLCYPPASRRRIDHVATDESYSLLREQVRNVPLRLTTDDVHGLADTSLQYDYVYLSNIGYLDDYQGTLARRFLLGGSRMVGLSLRRRRSLPQVLDEYGRAYASMQELPAGVLAINVFLNRVQARQGGGGCVRDEAVLPGRMMTLGPVTASVVGVTIGDDFPVYAEVLSDIAAREGDAG